MKLSISPCSISSNFPIPTKFHKWIKKMANLKKRIVHLIIKHCILGCNNLYFREYRVHVNTLFNNKHTEGYFSKRQFLKTVSWFDNALSKLWLTFAMTSHKSTIVQQMDFGDFWSQMPHYKPVMIWLRTQHWLMSVVMTSTITRP